MPTKFVLFDKLLDIVPRDYLCELALKHTDVRDPTPVVRSSLKSRILHADNEAMRLEVAIWLVKNLLPPTIESLDLR